MIGKYKVITLCGSTRFKDAFIEAQKCLTLEGNIAISFGLFDHSGDDVVWTEGAKEMLDDMHMRKSIWPMKSSQSMSAAISGPVPDPKSSMPTLLGKPSGIWSLWDETLRELKQKMRFHNCINQG